MSDLNIDDFYADAARILLRLYALFPRKDIIFVEDIIGPEEPDDFGLLSKRHNACYATMLWLAEEGYLRYIDNIREEALDQAVLSHKAFIALSSFDVRSDQEQTEQQLPGAIKQQQKAMANRIKLALKSKSSEAVKREISKLLRL